MYTLAQAMLVGVLLESIFYGTYLLTFLECIGVFLRKRRQGHSIWLLGSVTLVLFILITMHLVIDIQRTYYSFTFLDTAKEITEYWADISSFTAVFKTAVYDAVTLVSDLFIVYRCWAVWGHSWLVVSLPLVLFLADIALAIWVTHSLTLASSSNPVFAAQVSVHVKYFYILTLVVNLLSTVLISYRIYSSQRFTGRWLTTSAALSNVASILIESAAAYSVLLIIMIAAEIQASVVMFTILTAMPSAIGLIFSYIILRVSRGVGQDEAGTGVTQDTKMEFNTMSRLSGAHRDGQTTSGGETRRSRGARWGRRAAVGQSTTFVSTRDMTTTRDFSTQSFEGDADKHSPIPINLERLDRTSGDGVASNVSEIKNGEV